jgi:hypothetical protein
MTYSGEVAAEPGTSFSADGDGLIAEGLTPGNGVGRYSASFRAVVTPQASEAAGMATLTLEQRCTLSGALTLKTEM